MTFNDDELFTSFSAKIGSVLEEISSSIDFIKHLLSLSNKFLFSELLKHFEFSVVSVGVGTLTACCSLKIYITQYIDNGKTKLD